jgi:DNA-directed RNA polymerase sigma subunit (sigma70/sigma32)
MFYRKEPEVHQKELDAKPTEFETQYGNQPTCFEVHETWCLECDKTDCRNWMDYAADLNCAVVCARKHENGLSLREVAERMAVSFPRVSQIEHAAFKKLGIEKDLEEFEEFQSE